jgi:hypothetical protein
MNPGKVHVPNPNLVKGLGSYSPVKPPKTILEKHKKPKKKGKPYINMNTLFGIYSIYSLTLTL